MGSCIMDDEGIPYADLRQLPLFGKLVIILTEAARHVHHFQGTIWIGNIGDVVVGPVEGRPHEIGCRGIYPHIAAIGVLDMEDLGDQVAMWRQHEAA